MCILDFQKAAALLHEFLLKLSFDSECAELRDALNLALLHMQRYYRLLRNRMQNIDKSNGSVMAQSLRGLSPMTPFKDTPDKFQWKWLNLDNPKVANTMPADVHKDMTVLHDIIIATKQGNDRHIMELIDEGTIEVFLNQEYNCVNVTCFFCCVLLIIFENNEIIPLCNVSVSCHSHDHSLIYRSCSCYCPSAFYVKFLLNWRFKF